MFKLVVNGIGSPRSMEYTWKYLNLLAKWICTGGHQQFAPLLSLTIKTTHGGRFETTTYQWESTEMYLAIITPL